MTSRMVAERLVLADSHARGMQLRRAMAARGDDMLGMRSQTPASLVAGLWELCGDGRRIIDDVARRCVMRVILDSLDDEYAQTKGMHPFLCGLVRQAAGLDAFDKAASLAAAGADPGTPDITKGEALALRACGLYARRIESLGLVEEGGAATALARIPREAFPHPLDVSVACDRPLSPQVEALLGSAPDVGVTYRRNPADGGLSRLPEGIRLRFAFPSGRYAQAALVEQLLSGDVGLPAIVCTARPADLAQLVAPALVERGLTVATSASVGFSQTVVGRVLWRIRQGLRGLDAGRVAPSALKAALADAASSPLAGIPSYEARNLDILLRADRAMPVERCMRHASAASPQMAALVRIASGQAREGDADLLAQQARSAFGRLPARRIEELGAIGSLAEAMDLIAGLGGKQELVLDVLAETGRNSAQALGSVQPQGPADVTIASLESASLLEPRSFATAVLLDQTSVDYPVSQRDDAADTLLAKLGIRIDRDDLALARRTFSSVLALADGTVVLSRPLNDADAEPTYPSAMLSELIDCYRANPSATDDIDNAFAVPAQLLEGHLSRGEDALYANAVARAGATQEGVSVEAPSKAPSILRSQDVPLLSPSALDVYLACPRKWLLTREVRSESLDEGFTPLERGIFAHEALERFVRTLTEGSMRKLRVDEVPRAQDTMRGICEQLVAEQRERDPLSTNRLVATTQLEEREVDGIIDDLATWPGFEATLLPRYAPGHLEYEIPANEAVAYGGCRIYGRIDRIDVDESGHLVVIDYKGSVADRSYDPGLEGHRVQSLVYAAVAARALGLSPAGALYVSYGWRHQVRGAFDACLIDPGDVPGASEASALSPDGELAFDELMDLTEQRVAEASERMREGCVDARPASADACRTCPLVACEGRLS